ncbi:alpha/beta hydrolase [Pseudonocardia asaccharolytica]|uniref:Monoacylglycerol lipase n=1 Tax=Pseudonocardia asaccharolytica DSM 44247 = NBRC 16224 TaxID=1123024 RepID=A0A511CZG7_9PSEU|nr:alpha/beta hydrolase [Pseudonocardia asaccharolytica]GEL17942.1 monoacylglycerol lipase [Pseudonocardia asaccharolytica DSM 44247 = NBRC 16224]
MAAQAQRVEGRLVGARGVELFWQGWLPGNGTDPPPTGVLLLCHGLGEHTGRYGNVVDTLVPDGWAVYGLDHRGHGRSGGRRAHLDRYGDWLADYETFRRHVVARHPGLPVFLLGHSMGGQIALAYALDHQDDLRGLVLSAPALASDAVPKAAVPLLSVLAKVAPTLRPAGIDEARISKDPVVVADYRADPLVHHGNPTLALSSALFAQFDVLPERARGLRIPLLLQHGTDDRLTDPVGSRRLQATHGSVDATVRFYDGLWHEIYNEPERAAPLTDLREWLAAHR